MRRDFVPYRSSGRKRPVGRYERFDAQSDLKQVTTYDEFGDRIRQYDVSRGLGGGRRSPA